MRQQTECEVYVASTGLPSQGSCERKVCEPQMLMLEGINAFKADLTFALSPPQR